MKLFESKVGTRKVIGFVNMAMDIGRITGNYLPLNCKILCSRFTDLNFDFSKIDISATEILQRIVSNSSTNPERLAIKCGDSRIHFKSRTRVAG